MHSKIPLSVVIITKNEESNIKECLESVKWADEIIVVDDQSTDKTVEIVQQYTDRVFQRKMDIEGRHRNWAYAQAHNSWVLSLDADERVTSELKEEIIKAIENPGEFKGFAIPRRNYIGNYWVKYGGWYPSAQAKLFLKSKFRYEEVEVHPRAFLDGPWGKLKNDIIHYSYKDIEEFLNKMNKQTTLEAIKWVKDKRKMGLGRALWRTYDRFMRTFLRKKAYRDGLIGFMVSLFAGFYQVLSYAKYWEIRRKERIKVIECDICGSLKRCHRLFTYKIYSGVVQGLYDLLNCQECGLNFIHPQPLAENLKLFYLSDQLDKQNVPQSDLKRLNKKLKRFNSPMQKLVLQECKGYNIYFRRHSFFRKLLASILKLFTLKEIIPFRGEGKILDIGCNTGLYLYMLKRLGWDTYGVEINPIASNIAQKLGNNIFSGRLEDTYYPSSYFDVVRLNHILEHLSSPTKTFQETLRILKPNGIIYLTVPNQKSFAFKVFREIWYGGPTHLYGFSLHSLSYLCKKFSLKINKVKFKCSKGAFLTCLRQWGETRSGFISTLTTFLSKNKIFCSLLVSPFCLFLSSICWGDILEVEISR